MKVTNRRYHRDYQTIETYEAGISLLGAEVKSVRAGNIKLEDAFVKLIGKEAVLVNADIQIYKFSRPQGYDARRTRKLLLHKRQLVRLRTKLAGGNRLTLAPISCYNKGHIFKLQIALCKGRREIEKKKLERARDIKMSQKKEAKEYMKKER